MNIPLKSVTKGSNTNVSPLVHPIEQPYLMNGCNNAYKIGAVTKDTGYELLGTLESGKPITGLYNFRQSAGVEKMLATVNDSTSDDTQLFFRGSSVVVDSYPESNQSTGWQMSTAGMDSVGQCFTGTGYGLGSVKFYLKRTGTPTCSLVAKVYAISGSYGTTGLPTGTALATSTPINVDTIPTTGLSLIDFAFTGVNQINLAPSTYYVATVEVSSGSLDGSNYIDVGTDNTAPIHTGNPVYKLWGGSWAYGGGIDVVFYVYSSSTAWTEIPAAETAWANKADMKVEMESFIGYCFMVGHGETDGFLPVASLTGNTFSTTTNLTSMPQGKFIKRYNGQLYVANCYTGGIAYPFRVYNSSFPVAGAITWDSVADPTAGYKDVDYSEGITGMETAFGSLFVFTEYQTYAWDQASWLPKWAQGCVSHRTIKKHKAYLIWCDLDGVQVSTGGQPQNISGEIDTLYKSGNPKNYHAEIVNEQYHLYLGNVSTDGINYANMEAVFDIGKSLWFVREYYDNMTIFAKYNDSGRLRLYMGTSSGQIMNKGQYADSTLLSSDNGHDISSSIELAPFHLDNLDRYKKLNSITCYSDRAGGVKVYARVVDNTSRILTPYMPIGELTRFINTFHVDIDDGVIIQIMLQETGKNPYWSFLGYTMEVLLDSVTPKY